VHDGILNTIYYVLGCLAVLIAGIKIGYGWFRQYDNATRFTKEMAKHHLPYIYNSLYAISKHLGIDTERPPDIKFQDDDA